MPNGKVLAGGGVAQARWCCVLTGVRWVEHGGGAEGTMRCTALSFHSSVYARWHCLQV